MSPTEVRIWQCIMNILHVNKALGVKKAIPWTTLLAYAKTYDPKANSETLADVCSKLPICTCKIGVFIPKTGVEVEKYRAYVTPAIGEDRADARCRLIYATFPKLAPKRGRQTEMFKEES